MDIAKYKVLIKPVTYVDQILPLPWQKVASHVSAAICQKLLIVKKLKVANC